MEEKKSSHNYSKNIPIIIGIIIFLVVIVLALPKNKDSKQNKTSNTKTNIEVIESDNLIPESQGNSSGIQSNDMGGNLGAASVGEILGSESESQNFYGQPSIDKLLEGKEIEVGE